MRIVVAVRAFFAALFSRTVAESVREILQKKQPEPSSAPGEQPAAKPKPTRLSSPPGRNDALTLLAALQREARLVDIVKESLDQYSDAEIGAAARDVLKDCGTVLDRLFGLQPIVDADDGAQIATPERFDAARYRVTGDVSGVPPFQGVLMHHGWEASRCELPTWSGSSDSARVIAPVEIEVKR